MQGPDIVQVSPEKAQILRRELLPKPYVFPGLSVQGVSRDRLTPRPNENITVPDEVGRTIVRRNLARRFTESRIAIALAGLGLRQAALTVRGLVRASITFAGLARVAASLPPSQSTPTAAHHSDPTHYLVDDDDGSLLPRGQVITLPDCPTYESLTPTVAHRFEGIELPAEGLPVEEEVWLGGNNYCKADELEVEL